MKYFLKLYETYSEAAFLDRPNRFVMALQTKDGGIIHAHVPNTGRMEEFCTEGASFFITPTPYGKHPYKVIATRYQDEFVFLDTIKVNTLFSQLLINNHIPEFQNATHVKREVTFGDSKFDFTFVHNGRKTIVEVKSCTLCHNRLAMFPDAPTLRGQRHLKTLERLANDTDYDTWVIFLILNASAERFVPNFHTDFDYSRLFLTAQYVHLKAFRLNVVDPITIDLASLQEIQVDYDTLATHCHDKGSYLLVLENSEDITASVGKLGQLQFQKGWYVYVGSAFNSLIARLKRHQRKRKKQFWHIDYIASTVMKVRRTYPIRSANRLESELAQILETIADKAIHHFGASDTQDVSHLFYFRRSPLKNRAFINAIFTARTL